MSSTGAEDLAAALAIVRNGAPGAFSVVLCTSDQQVGYGFILSDVRDIEDESLPHEAFARLEDEVNEYLSDLDWDGVVGEDHHGYATLRVGL